MRTILGFIGLGLVITGIAVGYLTVADCGSPFSPSDAYDVPAGCALLTDQGRTLPLVVIGVGLSMLLGVIVDTYANGLSSLVPHSAPDEP